MTNELSAVTDMVLPLVMDTEYTSASFQEVMKREKRPGRFGVTVQACGIHEGDPVIFIHPHQKEYAKKIKKDLRGHTTLETPFAPVDYLLSQGYKAEIFQVEESESFRKLPAINFCIYAHFANAELFMIILDTDFQEDVIEKILKHKIEMKGSQISTRSSVRFTSSDAVPLPWAIDIGGIEFRTTLTVIDTVAIHGTSSSYKKFCENSGIKLPDKKSMDDWKAKMNEAFFQEPDLFDAYAIGDLKVYKALDANAEKFQIIWNEIGINEYQEREPHLTTGSTMRDIFMAKLLLTFGIDADG